MFNFLKFNKKKKKFFKKRIQGLINPNNPIFVLYLLHAIFSPLVGFLDSLCYLINGFSQSCKNNRNVINGEIEDHKFGGFIAFYDHKDTTNTITFNSAELDNNLIN